jgi:hypothetical protein
MKKKNIVRAELVEAISKPNSQPFDKLGVDVGLCA